MKEEGRRKKEEARRKKEEGRRKKEEARGLQDMDLNPNSKRATLIRSGY
jgi:hypothetical protein